MSTLVCACITYLLQGLLVLVLAAEVVKHEAREFRVWNLWRLFAHVRNMLFKIRRVLREPRCVEFLN